MMVIAKESQGAKDNDWSGRLGIVRTLAYHIKEPNLVNTDPHNRDRMSQVTASHLGALEDIWRNGR